MVGFIGKECIFNAGLREARYVAYAPDRTAWTGFGPEGNPLQVAGGENALENTSSTVARTQVKGTNFTYLKKVGNLYKCIKKGVENLKCQRVRNCNL